MIKEKNSLLKFFGILFLIIVFLSIPTIYDSQAESTIPERIKELTKSWSEDKLSNEDFAEAITYLIKNDMLKLPEMEFLITENQQLKQEMTLLKSQLSEYEQMLQTEEKLKISVNTSKPLYGPGDDIVIFGTVSSVVEDHEIGIVISDSSGKILAIAKIPPNDNKSYGFVAKSNVFKQSGDYKINVYYGGVAYDNIEYSYRPVFLQN